MADEGCSGSWGIHEPVKLGWSELLRLGCGVDRWGAIRIGKGVLNEGNSKPMDECAAGGQEVVLG